MTSESKELTLPERAALALGSSKIEAELRELVTKSKDIKEIKNADGRDECHAAAMVLRTSRTSITKLGKAAREDAKAFATAVIAAEDQLVAITEPEEKRLIELRDAWDAKLKAEKDAAIAAERKRVEDIKTAINDMRNMPMAALGKSSIIIDALIIGLTEHIDPTFFEEFIDEAKLVRLEALDQLGKAKDAAITAEEEAKRIEAERAELEELRKKQAEEQAERDRLERLASEERERVAAIERKREADQLAADRAKFAAEQADIERIRKLEDEARAARMQVEREAMEAENERLRLERARIATEAAALEAQRNPVIEPVKEESKPIADAVPEQTSIALDDEPEEITDDQVLNVAVNAVSSVFGITFEEANARLKEAINR